MGEKKVKRNLWVKKTARQNAKSRVKKKEKRKEVKKKKRIIETKRVKWLWKNRHHHDWARRKGLDDPKRRLRRTDYRDTMDETGKEMERNSDRVEKNKLCDIVNTWGGVASYVMPTGRPRSLPNETIFFFFFSWFSLHEYCQKSDKGTFVGRCRKAHNRSRLVVFKIKERLSQKREIEQEIGIIEAQTVKETIRHHRKYRIILKSKKKRE